VTRPARWPEPVSPRDRPRRTGAPTRRDQARHCFATRLLETGYGVRVVQELLARKAVRTIVLSTHVLDRGGQGVRGPSAGL